MARLARVIAVGVPHHITQRANARRFILHEEAERRVYLDLPRGASVYARCSRPSSGYIVISEKKQGGLQACPDDGTFSCSLNRRDRCQAQLPPSPQAMQYARWQYVR